MVWVSSNVIALQRIKSFMSIFVFIKMFTMGTVTIKIDKSSEAAKLFLAYAKTLPFAKVEEEEYDPEFVKKIEQSRKDYQDGKGRKTTIDDLNQLWK